MDSPRVETEQMELVGVTHVADAITFWAQNVDDESEVNAIGRTLCDKCHTSRNVQGTPSFQKIYAARFSEDQFWYRCRVQQQTEDKFQVFYIDYGNSEELDRSVLVELPDGLEVAPLAKKYRFWGVQIPSEQDTASLEQGKAFLQNLINGKKLRLRKKSVCFDGTILVQAFQGTLSVGEELVKMQFARLSVPAGRDGPLTPSRPPTQDMGALWPLLSLDRTGQGDADTCLPKLRPAHTPQAPPQVYRDKSTATSLLPASSLKKQVELLEENCQLREELQRLQMEIQNTVEEKILLQQRVEDLDTQLQRTTQVPEVQTEQVQTEHVQTAEVQTEHVQTAEVQTEQHVQTAEVQTEQHVQTAEVQTECVQMAEAQTEHVQTAEAQTQCVQTAEAQTEHVQTAEAQTECVQTAEAQTEHMQTAEAQTEHVQTAEAQTEHMQTAEAQTEHVQTADAQTEHVQTAEAQTGCVQMAFLHQLSCLGTKVESVRQIRASNPSSTVADTLMEAVDVVVSNSISAPAVMATLDVAWAEFEHAREKLKACIQRDELEALVAFRDQLREKLLVAVETFLQETNELPITARIHTLEELLQVRCVCAAGAVAVGVQQGAFEELRLWRRSQQQQSRAVRRNTDRALSHLQRYLTSSLEQLLCVSEVSPLCASGATEGLDTLFKLAEAAVDQEITLQGQSCADTQLILSTQQSLVQLVQSELSLLRNLKDKHTLCSQFKQDAVLWQSGPPSLAELLSIKKQIRSLHTQLRWKQMETSVLEEAEERDLTEIVKKKEEITETRKALLQHISREQKEYEKLVALTVKCFPELPRLHPEADILTYMTSGGALLMSLDRDMLDTEPMRELSARRPLLCSEFLGQRVILKGYCVEVDTEEKVLERAMIFHQTQKNCPHLLPLLGLFYGKNDPLAYVMVPYLPNSSLRVQQKRSPLTSSKVGMVMRGVALGLQALHAAGITHGSLHPGNVFISNQQQGIVGDYDLTKTPEQRAVDGVMKAGNISLLSPECHQGGDTTTASDMYAYGCLLLWLNHPEFDGALDPNSQTLDTSALNLEPQLGALLSKLLTGCGRLTAAEALQEHYFLTNHSTALE